MHKKLINLFRKPKNHISYIIEKIINIFTKSSKDSSYMLNSFITSLKDMNYINYKDIDINNLKKKIYYEISSCYLLYEDSIENIIGIITYQDLVNYIFNNKSKNKTFKTSKFLFLPYMADINDVLQQMLTEEIKFIIAIDTRGNPLGFFEKYNIINYFEKSILLQEKFKDNTVKISGGTLIEHIPWKILEFQVCYKLGIRTIGGFLSYYTGYVPSVNEVIKIDNLEFQILEATDRKINLISIKKISNIS
ncbi:hypothetical protein AB836_01335 [Rickettsiales bacterium (ex Bugula neritina AB1)]|nr:hypothetical protein AB836_01335 [Rickettsiales bacterium (ex Bugula neritina AB1)]